MTRVIIPLIALALMLASCGGGSPVTTSLNDQPLSRQSSWDPLAPSMEVPPLAAALESTSGTTVNGREYTALTAGNQPDSVLQQALAITERDGRVVISATVPIDSAALHIEYDAEYEHVVSAAADRNDALSVVVLRRGLVAIGLSALNGRQLAAGTALAELEFAAGADEVERAVAAISQVPRSAVKDLVAVWDGEGSGTLSWYERHNGDYNLDGEVGVADITPIGANFNVSVVEGNDNWATLEVADGNENGLIEVADLTPIGQSFQSFITGYNVYRTALTTPDEVPSVEDSERWDKVENTAEPSGPSAPRDYNNQKTRLMYTFIDTPEAAGDYGWYVVPVGRPGETPYEGPASNVATAAIGPPGVALSFEIQSPHSELLNVGTEFYLGVKVANVEGLFSANVRFEYDATLVEFVEAVASYTDGSSNEHSNLLTPPLFVGAAIDDVGGGYREVGFNATQRKGIDEAKDGEGFLGYVKFRCIGDGINDECFRFPQSSSFLYLWGETYGVPVGAPELGEPQLVNIAE
ncbi:hypothetical protein JW859_12055 [bacterium]|nr:hypothetical protein [bacterium]